MKKKCIHHKKIYKVLWSYYDAIGTNSGVTNISARTRGQAEKIFYDINPKYVIGHTKDTHQPIFNPQGGFVCESILTVDEWVAEGKPSKI